MFQNFVNIYEIIIIVFLLHWPKTIYKNLAKTKNAFQPNKTKRRVKICKKDRNFLTMHVSKDMKDHFGQKRNFLKVVLLKKSHESFI